jgi:hypothetical protein
MAGHDIEMALRDMDDTLAIPWQEPALRGWIQRDFDGM